MHVPKLYFLGELEFIILFINTNHLWLILVISRNLSVFLFCSCVLLMELIAFTLQPIFNEGNITMFEISPWRTNSDYPEGVMFPFYISVLIITELSTRVYGVALILFGVIYSLLYEGKEGKKLYWITPDDTVLFCKIFVYVWNRVRALNFFFFTQL